MATKENTQEGTKEVVEDLQDFTWDDGTSDFFEIAGTAVEKDEVEEVIEKVKDTVETEEEKEDTPKSKEGDESEEVDEDDNFFGIKTKENPKTGEVTTEEVEEEEEEDKNTSSYKSLAEKMKEQGIFQNVEFPEDEEEITEEQFIELQDTEVESRVGEALEGFFEELDDDGAAFLKFKKEGGDTADFFKVYSKGAEVPTGDLDDEAYQIKVSRYHYANVEKLDAEDIDDRIEWLKDSGKLEKYANKFDTSIKEFDKKQREDLQKATKEKAKAADAQRELFVSSVKEALDETDEIDNFKFNKKDKKDLPSFITKPSVKVGKNHYVTPMQSKLQTALRDKSKMLILAKLLMNDFDVSDLVNTKTTEKTKQVRKNIQRKKSVAPTSSGKEGQRKRGLADFDF